MTELETLSGTSQSMAYETKRDSFSPAFLIRRAYTCPMVGMMRPPVPFAVTHDRCAGPYKATKAGQERACRSDIIGAGPPALTARGPKERSQRSRQGSRWNEGTKKGTRYLKRRS